MYDWPEKNWSYDTSWNQGTWGWDSDWGWYWDSKGEKTCWDNETWKEYSVAKDETRGCASHPKDEGEARSYV